jgi:hypothetical protein
VAWGKVIQHVPSNFVESLAHGRKYLVRFQKHGMVHKYRLRGRSTRLGQRPDLPTPTSAAAKKAAESLVCCYSLRLEGGDEPTSHHLLPRLILRLFPGADTQGQLIKNGLPPLS